jgi:hypothetical protein
VTRRAGVGKSPRYISGRLSRARAAWVRTGVAQFVMLKFDNQAPPDEDDEDDETELTNEVGNDLFLMVPQPRGKPLMLNFTAMTEIELRKTRQFFDLLFTLAEPIVKDRDKVANNALANGDDSYARIYRPVPDFIIRPGTIEPDSKSVLDGSEDSPQGD